VGVQVWPGWQQVETPVLGLVHTGPLPGQGQGFAVPGALQLAPCGQQTGTLPAPLQMLPVGHPTQPPAVHTWLGAQHVGGPPDGGLQTEAAAQQPPRGSQTPVPQQVGPFGLPQTMSPDGQTHWLLTHDIPDGQVPQLSTLPQPSLAAPQVNP
jgi:hypothetical protein